MSKVGPIWHFFRALPASTWGHYSQTLIFAVAWGHPKTLKNDSFHAR